MLIIDGIKIMIEVKNQTEQTIKSHPTETIEKFKKDMIISYNENMGKLGIFVATKATNIRNKAIDYDIVKTGKGNVNIIYISNLFINPDRLLVAISFGLLLLNTENKETVQNILPQIQSIDKSIEELEVTTKNSESNITSYRKIIKSLKQQINTILKINQEINIEEDILNHYKRLSEIKKNITMAQLVEQCKMTIPDITDKDIKKYGGLVYFKNIIKRE